MKFLCVECDESMEFVKSQGPEEGSLSVVFRCPGCNHRTALLTNPLETQLVRSLGVVIGGRKAPPEPLETVRETLAHKRGVAEGTRPESPLLWTEEAEKRLERVPEFARPMARRGIEQYARRHGCTEITPEVMEEARGELGM